MKPRYRRLGICSQFAFEDDLRKIIVLPNDGLLCEARTDSFRSVFFRWFIAYSRKHAVRKWRQGRQGKMMLFQRIREDIRTLRSGRRRKLLCSVHLRKPLKGQGYLVNWLNKSTTDFGNLQLSNLEVTFRSSLKQPVEQTSNLHPESGAV